MSSRLKKKKKKSFLSLFLYALCFSPLSSVVTSTGLTLACPCLTWVTTTITRDNTPDVSHQGKGTDHFVWYAGCTLIQPKMMLTFIASRVHFWLLFNLSFHRTLGLFSQNSFPDRQTDRQPQACCMGFFHPCRAASYKVRILAEYVQYFPASLRTTSYTHFNQIWAGLFVCLCENLLLCFSSIFKWKIQQNTSP